jgi:AP endonuclease 2
VGSGYDKGPAERLREEVDSTYRCNFFRWSSDVKKDLMKEKQSGG